MCIIIGKPAGIKLPKEEYIRNSESMHKDGIGIGLWKDKSNDVFIKKDFITLKSFLKWYKQNITKKDAYVLHFRNATSGLVDYGNRHPFPVTKNWKLLRKKQILCNLAVAHNGVIMDYSYQDKKFSDSQKFIIDILSDSVIKHGLFNKTIQKLILKFIDDDKLCFLTKEGKMLFLGEFEKEKGIYYSNDSYKTETTTPSVTVMEDYDSEEYWRNRNRFNLLNRSVNARSFVRSSINGEIEKRETSGDFFSECEKCHDNKFVHYHYHMETSQAYKVCDDCGELINKMKKLPKRLMNSTKKSIKKEDLIQCLGCMDWYDPKIEEMITLNKNASYCKNCISSMTF